MFKVKHELCPEIPSDIFMEKTKKQCSLRNYPDFIVRIMEQNLSQISDQIPWNTVPEETKQKGPLNSFKESIKMWYQQIILADLKSLPRWSWFYQYH